MGIYTNKYCNIKRIKCTSLKMKSGKFLFRPLGVYKLYIALTWCTETSSPQIYFWTRTIRLSWVTWTCPSRWMRMDWIIHRQARHTMQALRYGVMNHMAIRVTSGLLDVLSMRWSALSRLFKLKKCKVCIEGCLKELLSLFQRFTAMIYLKL